MGSILYSSYIMKTIIREKKWKVFSLEHKVTLHGLCWDIYEQDILFSIKTFI